MLHPCIVTVEVLYSRDDMEVVLHSDDAFAPVAYINLNKMHLEQKPLNEVSYSLFNYN